MSAAAATSSAGGQPGANASLSPRQFPEDRTGPKQLLEAVVDAIRPATPPPVSVASKQPPTLQTHPESGHSALVFRPALPASSSTPDISPTAPPASRFPEQLPIPTSTPIPSYRFPPLPNAEASSSRPSTPSKLSPFSALRRGSLAPTSSTPADTRRGSDPSNMELSRLSSPGAGPSSSRETVEMTSLSVRAGVMRQKPRFEEQAVRSRSGDTTKEDLAMAKWRKWIVEQPDPGSTETSPSKSFKNSPAGTHIPMLPLSPAVGSPRSSAAGHPRISSSRTDSDDSDPRVERIDHATLDHLTTETMRALRDVELAVDENVLAKSRRAASQPRRMSTNPRVSDIENPFIDISSRLASRRVRPLVIELIQGLGHYIDAVWCLRYPGKQCPWIIGTTTPEGRKSIVADLRTEAGWRSRMITAVQGGKADGFVPDPTMADLKFWEDEVKYSLRDVDDVVGIYKGVAWAFNTAIMTGRYGEIVSSNVVGKEGDGGNIARLLNDLEEAMWGDAPPRPTDLAYELPDDFDPYAVPTADELVAGGGGPSLSAFFGESNGGQPAASAQGPAPEEVYNLPLPELQAHGAEASEDSAPPVSPAASQISTPAAKPISDPLGLDAYRAEGHDMTLEEIGRKRHEEWLASRSDVPW